MSWPMIFMMIVGLVGSHVVAYCRGRLDGIDLMNRVYEGALARARAAARSSVIRGPSQGDAT